MQSEEKVARFKGTKASNVRVPEKEHERKRIHASVPEICTIVAHIGAG